MYIELIDYVEIIKKAVILDHVNIRFEQGKIYGLKGKNGSGKTMLMRAVCGLIKRTSGKVIIDGKELEKDISFPPSVGVLIENPAFLSEETGFWNLKILASIQGRITDEDISKTIERVGLDPKDKRKYRKYSLGMKQRLGIAAAIMEKPDIILLDEPINALDEDGALLIRDILKEEKERGAIIILACHDTEELELLSDEIIVISDGKLVREN